MINHITTYDNRLRFARISFVMTCVLLGLSAYYYQPRFIGNYTGFYLFLLSLPFIRFSFPLFPEIPSPAIIDTTPISQVIRWNWIMVAIVCMILLTMINMPQTWIQPWQQTLGLMNASPHMQMLLLCIGLITVIYGFGGRFIPRRIDWKRHHIILLGIVLLGGGIRLWNLEYAIHMFVDELFFLSDVISLNTEPSQILLPIKTQYTDVFSYMQMIFVNTMGPSLTSLRIVAPLISMFGLVVIYGFVRQLFSLRVALLSAFLLAILPVYIHFGRIGMNMVFDPIFGMIGFMYFLRGLRHHQQSDFAIAGVALGLTHYFYEGGRIFFTLFLLCWLVWVTLLNHRKPTFNLPNLRHILVFVFCLAIVTLPFYHTLWSNSHTLTQRLNATRSPDFLIKDSLSDFLLSNEVGHLGAPIQRYIQSVAHDNFYQSEDAYILPFSVLFFLLGFGILLWRIHTLHGAMFVWWVLGVAIGNSLIFDGFSAPSPRYVVAYGAIMLITALGIHTMWAVMTEWVHQRWRRWVHLAFLVYLGSVGFYQVGYYFNTIVPSFHEYVFTRLAIDGTPRPTYDDMILRAVKLPENTTLHILTNLVVSKGHTDHVPQFFGRHPDEFMVEHTLVDDVTIDYLEDLSPDRNHVFTFMPYDESSLVEMIEQVFDITKIEGSPLDIPGDVEMKFYHVSTTIKP